MSGKCSSNLLNLIGQDYDFFRVVLNLERYNLPQEKECLVLQKLLHAF